MKKHLTTHIGGALARVSSARRDVDLSGSGQLGALKDYAKAKGCSVAREYKDEARTATCLPATVPGNDRPSRPPQRALLGNRRGLGGLSVRETRGCRSAEENSA